MDNRSLSHTRWKCQYHIVFIPKYRKRFVAQILVDIKKEQDELKDILGSEYQDYNLIRCRRLLMNRDCRMWFFIVSDIQVSHIS